MSCEYPQTKSQPHFFLIFNFQLIKMFSDELEKISWEETTKAIYSKTDADVRRALGKKEHLDVNDFMALISPAATPYLEVMARLSQKYTMERFGKTISMFVPLYITNSCTNSCVYCGFHISNPMKRTILTEEEIYLLYEKKVQETGFLSSRSAEECVRRLVQRGLIAKGIGDTGADALYDLLSELYVIPISENLFLRVISFIRLTFFSRIQYSVTKRIFSKDKRSDSEKKVMRLANQAVLSTAEIIKCIDQNVLTFATDEDLLDVLYHDDYTTSDNIAYSVRFLPQYRPVITSVANLYLRKQIIFERS